MRTRFLALFLALASVTFFTTSCSSDDNSTGVVDQTSVLTLNLKGKEIKDYTKLDLEIFETNTGETIKEILVSSSHTLKLPKGSYKISVNGLATLTTGEEMQVGATATIDIINPEHQLTINLVVKSFSEDFIIEEIFFTGVRTNEGKLYTSGRYFKLTNNTDKVLKTGGLMILQSEFLNTVNHNVTPDIKSEAFSVKGVLMIPNEHSKDVEPGDFLVIADMAMNHKKSNIPAYDLSKADYEYPNLDNPKLGQVDNPLVPNAVVIFSTMNYNMFFLMDRASESFALARFPEGVTIDQWIQNHSYNYEYLNQAGNITSKTAMKVPNNWIIDGVNSSSTSKWLHNTLDNSIDSGWTGVGEIDSDPSRYGKSIRRKVVGTMENGKNLYKDTNNSTADFTRDSEPSLKNGISH